jgi:hypothetical protein
MPLTAISWLSAGCGSSASPASQPHHIRGDKRRGSRDPHIDGGVCGWASVGAVDEISVGGNGTNSAVVHYLGGDFGRVYPKASVPQVIVLERDVDNQITDLHVGPEREVARYIGSTVIWDWARQGAPLSK